LYCNRETFPKQSNFEKTTYTYKVESSFLPGFPNLFSNFIRIMRKNHIFALKKNSLYYKRQKSKRTERRKVAGQTVCYFIRMSF
jgi:hypothetical protein